MRCGGRSGRGVPQSADAVVATIADIKSASPANTESAALWRYKYIVVIAVELVMMLLLLNSEEESSLRTGVVLHAVI